MNIYSLTHKHCSKCKQILSIENFSKDKQKKDGFCSSCKQCKSITDKNYRDTNIDKIRTTQKAYYESNKADIISKTTEYSKKNKDRFKEHYQAYRKEYYIKNKERILNYGKFYRTHNKQKRYETNKKYNDNNKDKIRSIGRKYEKLQYSCNPLFRLRKNMRTLIGSSFRNNGYENHHATQTILGCSFDYLKTYIEHKFVDGMSWDNRSEWHIDHIIPLSSGKTEEEIIALNHYTNLQPLWATDNLKKSNKF